MQAKTNDRGRLLLGARRLAVKVFDNEERYRSMYNPTLQRELGLFFLGPNLAGYEGVIDAVLAAKVDAAMNGQRETASS